MPLHRPARPARSFRSCLALGLALSLAAAGSLHAANSDWPFYHGTASDRSAAAEPALTAFPAGGPHEVWRVDTPAGFSSFTVAGGLACTLILADGHEVCLALDATTGEERWRTPLGEAKYQGGGDAGADGNKGGDGPRSTPTLSAGAVYVYDASFGLHCLDAQDGHSRWSHDVLAEFGGQALAWQNAASPLVMDDRVLVAGGGPGKSLLAFSPKDGSLLWSGEDEKATHATPVAATLRGVPQVLFFCQSGLVAVAPSSGAVLWRAAFPYSVSTAASPVVSGDLVYCSAGYGVGAGVHRIVGEAGAFSAELVWMERNKLMNHWSTPVVHEGNVYGLFGFKEYGDAPLQCVDLLTHEVKWSQRGFGPGNCILVGDTLVVLSDAGELVLVDAEPDAYHELARAEVLEGKCWSSPAYADGRLYVRSSVEGKCLDLRR